VTDGQTDGRTNTARQQRPHYADRRAVKKLNTGRINISTRNKKVSYRKQTTCQHSAVVS